MRRWDSAVRHGRAEAKAPRLPDLRRSVIVERPQEYGGGTVPRGMLVLMQQLPGFQICGAVSEH